MVFKNVQNITNIAVLLSKNISYTVLLTTENTHTHKTYECKGGIALKFKSDLLLVSGLLLIYFSPYACLYFYSEHEYLL